MEVGQVDSGQEDPSLPAAGTDAALEDGPDSSGPHLDVAPGGAIDPSADAGAVEAANGEPMEVGQTDSSAVDQSPPTTGVDAAVGQASQDGSGAQPDTSLDWASDDTAGGTDQAPPSAGADAAAGPDSSDVNPDTSTGAGIIPDGTYRVTARHSGKVLDVYNAVTGDGTNVDQWSYNGGNNQLWTFTHLGGNVYKILGVQSRKALEVATASTTDGTNVDIRTYTGAANQQWTISSLTGGNFRLSPVSNSGSALDVVGASTADSANACQYAWLGGNNYNQQWSIQPP